jgi:hypothetical protein
MKNTQFKLPPAEFSNAMNFICKGFDFSDWENSKEWRIFNAGREAEALNMAADAKQAAERYASIVRARG